jgi:hypothetical protein
MLLTLFLTCFVSLAAAMVLLLVFGDRVRVASWVLGPALGVVLAVAAGQAAARLWQLDPRPVLVAEALLVALTAVVVAARCGTRSGRSSSPASPRPPWPIFPSPPTSPSPAAWPQREWSRPRCCWSWRRRCWSCPAPSRSRAATCCPVSAGRVSGRCSIPPTGPRCRSTCRPTTSRPTCSSRRSGRWTGSTTPNYEIVVIDHNTRDPAVWQRPSFARHDQHCSLDDDNLANHDGADILGGPSSTSSPRRRRG